MSIQPHRILNRIVDQVDRSDWPELESLVFDTPDGGGLVRVYVAPADLRYATPIHFWVHALRDELAAIDRRVDLVGAAGHALCREQSLSQWKRELSSYLPESVGMRTSVRTLFGCLAAEGRGYRMLESACRRSSVVDGGEWLVAYFSGHGRGESWRRETIR